MIAKRIIVGIVGFLITGLTVATAQELKPGEVLPELTLEQKADRLEGHFYALSVAFIKHAKENGTSVADAGLWLGTFFAKSWGDDQTPESFVRGMNRNWQMLDIKTEILEIDPQKIKAKRTAVMEEEQFQKMLGHYEVTLSEFQEFYENAQKGITNEFELTYSETREGNSIVFTVSAN